LSLLPAQRAAWLVVLTGGVAALQVGKLPPALPALQAELGLTLVQSGFLLSMVQLAGMSLAVFMGLLADGMGLRRSMVRGLCLLALASGLGAFATSVTALLALRKAQPDLTVDATICTALIAAVTEPAPSPVDANPEQVTKSAKATKTTTDHAVRNQIAHDLRDKGVSVRQIAARLKEQGYLSSAGTELSPGAIGRILKEKP
jgi:hypothetical protein